MSSLEPEKARGGGSSSSSGKIARSGEIEPAARLRKKTTSTHPLTPKAKPAKAVRMLFLTSGSETFPSAKSVLSISSGELVPAKFMSPKKKAAPAKAACKKPASQGRLKRPATNGPANAKSNKRLWETSQSFGYVHETRASQKAYIRAKPEMAANEYCLVNVNLPAGQKQDEVMDALVKKALEPGWTKESLVAEKCKLPKAGNG